MLNTEQHPAPDRYAKVYELVASGKPDAVIIKTLSLEFGCHQNTIRNDLAKLWKELEERSAEQREHRRNVMRLRLETLQDEVREVARKAREGFPIMGDGGEPVIVQDMKTASMAYKTCESLFWRQMQLDGLSESDQIKLGLLRRKLKQDLTEEELDAAIRAEIEAMPDDALDALLEKRRKRTEAT